MGVLLLILIPEGLLFRRYEPFIRSFFSRLETEGVEPVYSGPSNRKILERGVRVCVDEACLPVKIFHGQVSQLQESCDRVAVLRLMKCEFGESICPKFAGLPELVGSGTGFGSANIKKKGEGALAFTSPLYMNDRNRFKHSLIRDGAALGISKSALTKAFYGAYADFFPGEDREIRCAVINRAVSPGPYGGELPANLNGCQKYQPLIALLGHPYNTQDPFANMDLRKKLAKAGIRVIQSEDVPRYLTESQFRDLLKKPYWAFFRDNYGVAGLLADSKAVDGILYVSSFCCGTDSFTIEMVKNRIGDLPMLVLKLDEHTGEAGINTRLEAFAELLERRKRRETHIPTVR